jgi:hypothetical protein
MRRILSACWSMMIAVVSHPSEAIMLHRSLATHSEFSLFRVRAVSLQPRQPKPKSKEDLPHLVRRLVGYGWDYDRICHRVEREFPPLASTALERRNHREWIARLIMRYRHGESISPALLQ